MEVHRSTMTITRDMAMDAGDPSMEGAQWDWGIEWEPAPCPCCEGHWEDCPNCRNDGDETDVYDELERWAAG